MCLEEPETVNTIYHPGGELGAREWDGRETFSSYALLYAFYFELSKFTTNS